MVITERQKEILNRIIEEHIDTAQPVSSQLIEKEYNFGLCPATIRIEMQKLTEAGFIYQPHTSAGRIPTDKGYRFFVDELLEKEFSKRSLESEIEDWLGEEFKDTLKFLRFLTKNLATLSSNLALGYSFQEKIFWQEGWENMLQEPEFRERKLISNFANLIKNFEEEIEELETNSKIKVYIGKENPFPKAKEFSIIISGCCFPRKKKGVLAILGPKRMTYEKNINSLNTLTKLLNNI